MRQMNEPHYLVKIQIIDKTAKSISAPMFTSP